MDAARWQRIRLLFEQAAVLPAADRAAFLGVASEGDDELHREVERLLAADSAPEQIFTESPQTLAAGILDDAEAEPLRIGPYRTVGVLGRGGMGQVYLARPEEGNGDAENDSEVAIKVLRRGMDSEDVLRRFRSEGLILGRLEHPNIARFYDSGMTDDGRPFLVMECLDCLPLTVYCDTHRLPIPHRLRLFRDACAAVHYAHEQGVVHRDLKPGNVVVTDEVEVKLLDFGIAKVLNAESFPLSVARTRTGFRVLTPEYASPEQIRGGEIGPATDVYGLGALLYELLTGHPPYRFAGGRGHEIERIVCEEEPTLPSVRAGETEESEQGDVGAAAVTPKAVSAARSTSPAGLRHKLSGTLDEIVMTALRKEPERRYASVAALAEDVKRYLDGSRVKARSDTPSYRIRKFARQHRMQLVGALTVLSLIVGTFGAATSLLRSSGAPELASAASAPAERMMLAVLPFDNRGPDEQSYFAAGVTDAIAADLAAFPELGVIASSSADRYRGSDKTPGEIGRELGAAYVLDGTIDFARPADPAGTIRVTSRLTRVADNTSIWSARYDDEVADVFAVRSAIAQQVAGALHLTLEEARRARLAKRPTQNLQAYTYYLRGNEFGRYEEDAESLQRAASMYEQAVAHDSSFAQAHARLAIANGRLWFYHFDRDRARLAAAKDHAEKALVLDPNLPDSYLALGIYYYFGKQDYAQAQQLFTRALALEPDYPEGLRSMGWVLRRRGRLREALSYFERLDRLDPLGADILAIAFTRQLLRDYPASRRAYSRILARAPDTPLLHALLARMLVSWSGAVGEAQRVLDEGEGRSVDNDFTHATAVYLDRLAGDDRAALERLNALQQEVLESQILYAPTAHLKARAERGMGERQKARAHEEEARELLAAHLETHLDDARAYAALGRVYAGLGRTDDAIRAGRRAVELVPIQKDAVKGPVFVEDLAAVYTMIGRYDAAIDQLEILLAHPGFTSATLLRIDPTWEPLRDHPRFQALVRKRAA
ncbi:serine/threonine-protein kinase [soil metagenome]